MDAVFGLDGLNVLMLPKVKHERVLPSPTERC